MKAVKYILAILFTTFFVCACATTLNEEIERTQFALDHGNWEDAIAHGKAALEETPSSVKAALLLSAGYAGRGGFTITGLTATIADNSRHEDLFDAVQDALIEKITNPADLRHAIATLLEHLRPEPARSHNLFGDYAFQAAALMAIEAFVLPSLAAQNVLDGPIDTSNVTDEMKDIVQDDFLDSDNMFAEAGLSDDNELLRNVREIYCVLKNVSSSEEGFDVEALQDITLCQLSLNDGEGLAEGDFNSPNINSCSDFDYDACENAPPTEL